MLAQGASTAEACRRIAVSEQAYHRWRKEYGGFRRTMVANRAVKPARLSSMTRLGTYQVGCDGGGRLVRRRRGEALPWVIRSGCRRRRCAGSSRICPLSHGVSRVDDRRVVSGIVFVIGNGLRWRDAPAEYGPHKTIYARFVRWSRPGVFDRIFAALAAKGGKSDRLMIDATHLKAHRTAANLLERGGAAQGSGDARHRRNGCAGCSPTDRAHQGRPELQAACRLRAIVVAHAACC